MREIGSMTWLMALVFILIMLVHVMKEIGCKMNSMAWALRLGLMAPNTTDNTCMVKSTGKVDLLGKMVPHIMVTLSIITCRDTDIILGAMAVTLSAIG